MNSDRSALRIIHKLARVKVTVKTAEALVPHRSLNHPLAGISTASPHEPVALHARSSPAARETLSSRLPGSGVWEMGGAGVPPAIHSFSSGRLGQGRECQPRAELA
ncbi:hypothetical protein SRHO_G00096950 [Serrasalmus rhombeus]